jgi:hypothetical protein
VLGEERERERKRERLRFTLMNYMKLDKFRICKVDRQNGDPGRTDITVQAHDSLLAEFPPNVGGGVSLFLFRPSTD